MILSAEYTAMEEANGNPPLYYTYTHLKYANSSDVVSMTHPRASRITTPKERHK